jgi:pyridoxal/pyridoxine/pyridoxamine kinase
VIEGMMAAQLFASHSASMECYRRAMLPEQTLEGRTANLVQAAKLTRANASVVEALAKYRNKGKQKIVIEHVHVYQGGQAAFIANGVPGEGVAKIKEVQPHAIGHAAGTPMRCADPKRQALPSSGHGKRTMQDARRTVAGSA